MEILKKKKSVIKECKECKKQFQTIRRDKIYCTRECAKDSNTKKWADKRYGEHPDTKPCFYCGEEFKPQRNTAKYCSRTCAQAQWKKNNPERSKEIRLNSRLKDPNEYWVKKRKYVDYLGGKCKHCNENRLPCITFHHLNPKNKITEVTSMINNRRINATEEDILTEVEKCILLCSNCHKIEEASPIWKEF